MHLIYDNLSDILWSDFSFFAEILLGFCVLAAVFCFLNSRFIYRENVNNLQRLNCIHFTDIKCTFR